MLRIDAIKAGRIEDGMNFQQRVWALTARVPRGKVVTYGDIARALGGNAYRAVGRALGQNPYAPDVPCHRVVGSTGKLTGFTSDTGLAGKAQLLEAEGVAVDRQRQRVDLTQYRHPL